MRAVSSLAALVLGALCSLGYHSVVAQPQNVQPLVSVKHKVTTIVISQFKYQPDTLTVRVGEIVEWKNVDIVPHTATAVKPRAFDSGRIADGASWRLTTRRRGTYEYTCTLHPNMKSNWSLNSLSRARRLSATATYDSCRK